MSLDEMKKVSTSAPLSDGRVEGCELTQTSEGQFLVTHLACLSGLSNSKGAKMGAEQKRRDCVKSSWEAKTRERAEC